MFRVCTLSMKLRVLGRSMLPQNEAGTSLVCATSLGERITLSRLHTFYDASRIITFVVRIRSLWRLLPHQRDRATAVARSQVVTCVLALTPSTLRVRTRQAGHGAKPVGGPKSMSNQ
jgi:hypothetical protein